MARRGAYTTSRSNSHKTKRVEFGSEAANERIFVARDGTRRVFHLHGRTVNRALDVENLAQQLTRSGYAAREKFDGGVIDPR